MTYFSYMPARVIGASSITGQAVQTFHQEVIGDDYDPPIAAVLRERPAGGILAVVCRDRRDGQWWWWVVAGDTSPRVIAPAGAQHGVIAHAAVRAALMQGWDVVPG